MIIRLRTTFTWELIETYCQIIQILCNAIFM